MIDFLLVNFMNANRRNDNNNNFHEDQSVILILVG